MFSLKSRFRTTGLRATIVAGAAVAALALAGINAGVASADPTCEGANVTGMGSSLQAQAHQDVWIPKFKESHCPGTTPTVGYDSTDSGTGLAAWSAFGGTSIDHEAQFIGTDQPPNAEQVKNIRTATAAQNSRGEAADLAVIPVAQTAVAIVANPPRYCTITKIKRGALEKVFQGNKLFWFEIGTASGIGCIAQVTRVVPADVSGTTYQFKHYLALNNEAGLKCLSAPNDTWSALQSAALNTTWPESCKGHLLSSPVKHSVQGGVGSTPGVGGTDEVDTVNATPGSIGFAALPDAEASKSGRTTVLALQNGTTGSGSVTYANPGTAAGQAANCGSATYAVPAQAQIEVGSGLNADWSQTYGSTIESATYPLCTLTWDLTFSGYQRAGFTESQATTVKDYLFWYGLREGGQEDIASAEKWYAPLPNTEEEATNVYLAAVFAAAQIG
jgi:hypothetical protein